MLRTGAIRAAAARLACCMVRSVSAANSSAVISASQSVSPSKTSETFLDFSEASKLMSVFESPSNDRTVRPHDSASPPYGQFVPAVTRKLFPLSASRVTAGTVWLSIVSTE